jgi:hypothetical protein
VAPGAKFSLFLKATRKLCQIFLYLNMHSLIGIVLFYALTSNANLVIYFDCFVIPVLYAAISPYIESLTFLFPLPRKCR